MTYETIDSGDHQEYASGMRRSSQDGKPRFELIRTKLQPYKEQMIYRYAMLLARGAKQYDDRNWEDGYGEEEMERAKGSLLRHAEQLIAGETDEDHAAAVWFNAQAIEYFRWRQAQDDGLTGPERLAKVARASEVNHLAAKKAAEMRRRERLHEAAQEFDAELTEDAKRLAEADGTLFYGFDGSKSGAQSLFQFESAALPAWNSRYSLAQERLGAQIAENFRRERVQQEDLDQTLDFD